MKTSTNTKSGNAVTSNTKAKKSGREREKRKSQAGTEKVEQNTDKGSPTKEAGARKYAGIGPDSLLCYSEQSSFEHLSDDLCYGVAEDISYKLRYIIHDALIKARLSGRNHILSEDIDDTFENLRIDKVYGASSTPNWIALNEHSISYLDDQIVNLVELSEQDNSFSQPGELVITRKWHPDITKSLKSYFEKICFAVVSNDLEVRRAALHDIRSNNFIGPVVEWLYNFGYFLLSKDITYDSLTLSALELIQTLEENAVGPQVVSEKLLKLLVRLFLQRLLRLSPTPDVLKPMCNVLAILCDRIPIREFVTMKVSQKLLDIKNDYALALVTILNELGVELVLQLMVPHVDYFLIRVEQNADANLTAALLRTYHIIYPRIPPAVHGKFYNVFGDALVPTWQQDYQEDKTDKLEYNWKNVQLQLIKTRKAVPHYPSTKRQTFHEVFPTYEKYAQPPRIKFKFLNSTPAVGRERFLRLVNPRDAYVKKQAYLVIGKRTLRYPIDKSVRTMGSFSGKCMDHTLRGLIL